MSFRNKRRQRTKRILDICANGEPIAYIAYNSQRNEDEGRFIWRTTKAFRKYRKDENTHKKYSHFMKDLKKCTAHCMEWLIFNTTSKAENLQIEEPQPKETKKKKSPIVEKKINESIGLLKKIEDSLDEDDSNVTILPISA